MDYQENALARSARKWVLALGIIDAIGVVSSIIGLITLFSLKSTDYASIRALGEAGTELIEIYQAQSTTLNLVIQGLLIVGQLFAVILLFRGASSIKKGLLMDEIPFYILFGLLVIGNIFNLAIGAGKFSVLSFASIAISLILVGIPFWKVSKLNKTAEENKE